MFESKKTNTNLFFWNIDQNYKTKFKLNSFACDRKFFAQFHCAPYICTLIERKSTDIYCEQKKLFAFGRNIFLLYVRENKKKNYICWFFLCELNASHNRQTQVIWHVLQRGEYLLFWFSFYNLRRRMLHTYGRIPLSRIKV